MGRFYLKFEELRGDKTIELKEIDSARFEYDSPDDAREKASTSNMTLIVTGAISDETDGVTLALINEWVKLEGQEAGAYCKVTLKVIGTEGRCVREYVFPQAFAVDYFEEFAQSNGTGNFTMKIRQRREKLANTQFLGGYIE